jgi:hypothetical protein
MNALYNDDVFVGDESRRGSWKCKIVCNVFVLCVCVRVVNCQFAERCV